MRIQYASDLHLELWDRTPFDETLKPSAPYLVLCGDTANLKAMNLQLFLEYCSENWVYVFWIPGNSELWNTSDSEDEGLRRMKLICSPYKNIKILYKDTFLLKEDSQELLIVGLSLWHKPRNNMMLHYHNKIYIKAINTPVDESIFKNAHKSQVQFLEHIIKTSKYPLLICSYYAPFTWLYEEDWVQEPKSALIDNELEKLVTFPVLSWIVGHNHYPIEYTRRYFTITSYQGSVLFVSNPRGKPSQHSLYRNEAVVQINPTVLDEFKPKPKEEVPIWVKLNR